MPGWILTKTEGVSESAVLAIRDALASSGPVEGPREFQMRAAQPPEWVQVVADAITWQGLLTAGVQGVIVGGLWRATRRPRAALRAHLEAVLTAESAQSPAVTIGQALAAARAQLHSHQRLIVGLSFPHEHFATAFEVTVADSASITADLLVFASRVRDIEETLKAAIEKGEGPLGVVQCRFTDAGEIEVAWMDDHGHVHTIVP